MKYLRIVILFLIFCNLPSYFLAKASASLGQISSYGTFLLIFVYYFFTEKKKLILPLITLGVIFFLVSILVSATHSETYIITLIKYFILIIMGAAVVNDTTKEEMFIILLLGSLSIIHESIFIEGVGGRYRGFYLNPNAAGYVCILGYCLSFSIDNRKLKLIGQFLFSVAGLMTFSRTFLLIWVLVSLISLLINYKNVYKIVLGVVLFTMFLSFGSELNLSAQRLHAFSGILDGKVNDDLKEDSREDTWAKYYDKILLHPIIGNGYYSFSGEVGGRKDNGFVVRYGVHNTFLMIIGEAGFFVLLYFLWIYGGFLVDSLKIFNDNPLFFLISFSLFLFMLTSHNYFDNYLVLFVSMWLYIQIERSKDNQSI